MIIIYYINYNYDQLLGEQRDRQEAAPRAGAGTAAPALARRRGRVHAGGARHGGAGEGPQEETAGLSSITNCQFHELVYLKSIC